MKKMTMQCECDRCGLQDSVDAREPDGWTVFTLLDAPKVGDIKAALATALGGGTDDRKDLCPRCTREVRTWFNSGKLPQPMPQPPVPPPTPLRDDDDEPAEPWPS